jgi:hypothetical protein
MGLSITGSRPTAVWRFSIVIVASLAFLWPAAVNHGALLFADTIQYTRGPDGALGKLLGPAAKSQWSIPRPEAPGVSKAQSDSDKALYSTPRAGRSIYYGLLANLGARTGDFWLTLLLQAIAASLSIDLLCRAMGWTRIRTFLIVTALASLTTTMAVYVDFVMPDVFAAVLIVAASALAAGADRLSRGDVAVAALLIAYSAATHTSHMAILAATLLVAVPLWLMRRKTVSGHRMAILAGVSAASLIAAGLATAGFGLAVKKAYHAAPIEIPFLTARMVSFDHPGVQWVREHCPQSGFAVCKVADRLPMTTNEFLWSVEPLQKTAFSSATLSQQQALGAEQWRFFFTVARDKPLQTARAFLRDWYDQITDFSLLGMNVEDEQRLYLDTLLPLSYEPVFQHTLAYRKAWPTDALTDAVGALSLLSLGALAMIAFRPSTRLFADDVERRGRLLTAALIVIVGILANAAACGGLSGVFGRYEARAMPPLILLGWFAAAQLLTRRRPAGVGAPRLPA